MPAAGARGHCRVPERPSTRWPGVSGGGRGGARAKLPVVCCCCNVGLAIPFHTFHVQAASASASASAANAAAAAAAAFAAAAEPPVSGAGPANRRLTGKTWWAVREHQTVRTSSRRHKEYFQPTRTLRDLLAVVVGSPALGKGHPHCVLVNGTFVQQVGVDGHLLVLLRLVVVKDGDDVSRGKLVHDEVCAGVESPVQGGGSDEQRHVSPVVHPHKVTVLI